MDEKISHVVKHKREKLIIINVKFDISEIFSCTIAIFKSQDALRKQKCWGSFLFFSSNVWLMLLLLLLLFN